MRYHLPGKQRIPSFLVVPAQYFGLLAHPGQCQRPAVQRIICAGHGLRPQRDDFATGWTC